MKSILAGAMKDPVAMAFAAVAVVGAVWLIALVVTGQRIEALPLEILLLGCGLVIGYNVGRRRPGNCYGHIPGRQALRVILSSKESLTARQ